MRLARTAAAWLAGLAAAGAVAARSARAQPAAYAPSAAERAFADTLERRTFDWFWETTPPNGLTPDRWPTRTFSSVAAVGFALTAYPIGAERGWVTRSAARGRALATLRTLWRLPQGPGARGVAGYQGLFYHFLDFGTGLRYQQVELSTIDTALLMGGVLACRAYFDRPDPAEREVRALADSLFRRVDWRWAQDGRPLVAMGWLPDSAPRRPDVDARGFIRASWFGYTEAMLLYAMALGSPTHPVDPAAWAAFTATYKWDRFGGREYVQFAPLFGHQYSQAWIDFRGIQDPYTKARGLDYFENSRHAALAQRAYATANPGGWRGYGPGAWGLTASDGPLDSAFAVDGRRREFHTYWARGAGADELNDDGTLAPTAVGGSVAFAPEAALPTLVALRRAYAAQGDALFGRYGFVDAFNPTLRDAAVPVRQGRVVPGVGWFDTDYLGIDQGPILLMLENYRSGLVWRLMRRDPYVARGLCRAGFRGGWLRGRC